MMQDKVRHFPFGDQSFLQVPFPTPEVLRHQSPVRFGLSAKSVANVQNAASARIAAVECAKDVGQIDMTHRCASEHNNAAGIIPAD